MDNKHKANVFIHVPTGEGDKWRNEGRLMAQVPRAGEYVCLAGSERWHRVVVVVHVAFDAHYDAEIYTESRGITIHDFDPKLSSR